MSIISNKVLATFRNLLDLSVHKTESPEESSEESECESIVVEVKTTTPAVATRRIDTIDDLIIAPSNDGDQIHNLNALLLSHRNSVKFDSKCFELMYEKATWINKWISRLIHIIGFITLIMSLAGVAGVKDMQPYILGTITLLFGTNGYKDHDHLESKVEALDQCVNFTNEIYTDINYFLYRSNHNVEALDVFVTAIDDKLKMFDRTTRLPVPINVKNNALDAVKVEKKTYKEQHNVSPSIYKHHSPRTIHSH
jgi:hypothetical protein